MDLDTVIDLVAALVASYNDGAEFYARWQRRNWRSNNYMNHAKGASAGSGGCCGLSASLTYSAHRIREAFDKGARILGKDFSVGDETCRASLATNLRQLQMRVHVLRAAAQGSQPPLGLYAVIKASEDVRTSTIRALHEQYRRQAAGRPTPSELSVGTRRSRASLSLPDDALAALDAAAAAAAHGGIGRAGSPRRSCLLTLPMDTILDGVVTPVSAGSRRSGIFSEPPSPPLTPTRADDWQASQSKRSSVISTRSRPMSAAFGLFCPEAMRYQLDPARSVANRACKCGQDFSSAQRAIEHLKDGFQMTPRFVAKSHHVGSGFGCVLCAPDGQMGTYESLASLRNHINADHDKWQMLHDRDMTTGSLGKPQG